MKHEDVLDIIDEFGRAHGVNHVSLAMHASLSTVLLPDLVNLLRINFVPGAEPIAEADVLLSNLCIESRGQIYEMHPAVRSFLKEQVIEDPTFGPGYARDVYLFLHEYARRRLRDADLTSRTVREALVALRWISLAEINPPLAAEALAAELNKSITFGNRNAALRVAKLSSALTEPLVTEDKVLLYASALEKQVRGQTEEAKQIMQLLGDRQERLNIYGVELPDLTTAATQMRLTPVETASTPRNVRTPDFQSAVQQADASNPVPPVRVFISYVRADDEPFVERLYHDLKDEFDVWWDRVSMPNRGLTFLQEIRDAIDHADRLLLVAGPRAFTSDYVRAEWQYAYETNKGINIALRLGDYPDLPEQLRGFDAPDFRSDDDYEERLAMLKRQLGEPVTPVGQFHNVPALPPHFLNRPEALDALRDLVIADVDKPTLISAEKRTTIVEGMAGIGKSVLATAFAHDRKVRFTFPDGIVWLTAGDKPSMYELYRAVGVALGDELSNYPDEITAHQNAQKVLTDKKCLLILDDVWELSVGRAFRDLISGTSARLLITTRNLQINDVLNANSYRLQLLEKGQAVDYLRSWVGDDPDLEAVAEKVDYLFLALELAGSRMKKDGLSGAEYLRVFDRVSRLKTDRRASDREDLEASINLGVENAFLDEDNRELYYALGAFPDSTSIPQDLVFQLWKQIRPDLDEFDMLETLNTLVDLALVERNSDDRTITLHDLLHSYTREKLGPQRRRELVEIISQLEKEPFVFISHSTKDDASIGKLVSDLEANGISTFVDHIDIQTGEPWQEQIEKAIRECSVAIIVITPSSGESQSISFDFGLIRQMGKPIIPILIGEYEDVPQELRHIMYADMRRDNYGSQLPRVIEALQWYMSGNTLQTFPSENFVFMSRTRMDLSFAQRLQNDLRKNSITSWSDENILPGQDWQVAINEAIKQCNAAIVVVSANSREREGIQQDITTLREHQKPIIPVVIDSFSNLPVQLRDIHAVDFSQDFTLPLRRLLEALEHHLADDQTGIIIEDDQQLTVTREQFERLVSMLSPNVASMEERRAFVTQTFFDAPALVEQIDWNGSSVEFANKLIRLLIQFGNIDQGEHSITRLLQTLLDVVGTARRREIESLLRELEASSDRKTTSSNLFIAYSRPDKAWVRELINRLHDNADRYNVWSDDAILSGEKWWDNILDNIESCDVFLFIISPESVSSTYCIAELEYASNLNKPILPIMLKPSRYPKALEDRRIQYLQVRFDDTVDSVFDKVIDGIENLVDASQSDTQSSLRPPRPIMPAPSVRAARRQKRMDVYISSTSRDLAEYRKTVEEAVLRMNMFPITMDTLSASNQDALTYSLELVDRADIHILILGHRYGYVPDDSRNPERLSVVELEYNEAIRLGKTILVFILDDKQPVSLPNVETDKENSKRLREFKARITRRHIVGFFTSPDDLRLQLLQALDNQDLDISDQVAAAAQQPSTQLLPNLQFIAIPGGEYTYEQIADSVSTRPQARIHIEAFRITKYPITNSQFAKFIEADGYADSRWWTEAGWQEKISQNWTLPQFWADPKWNGSNKPVVGISWYEAVAFCTWISNVSNEQILLASEYQWQVAAQGNDARIYPWGNNWDCNRCNCSVSPCSSSATTPFNQFEGKGESPFGVVDVSGNVWEWCLTDYDNNSVDVNTSGRRAIRGGSWSDTDPRLFRCDYRSGQSPASRSNRIGFRIVTF